jgi:ATP-dependent RNA helicase HelY
VITKAGKLLQLDATDFDDVPRPIGSIKVPTSFTPNRKDARKEVARRLRKAKLRPLGHDDRVEAGGRPYDHPVTDDPDLPAKLRAAAQADRIDREIAELERRVEGRNQSLGKDFDRVLDVLAQYGYVDVDAWTLTSDGDILARLFHESDLLVAEIVRDGVLDGLGAADVAALVSTLVYEHRTSDAPPAPWFSSSDVRSRWRRLAAISEDLAASERAVGLAEHRTPDPTFAAVAYAWVAGESFADVVADEELTGGDFVRTMKQLIDVLRQIAQVSPVRATRAAAAAAVEASFRGVVADSSAPTAPSSPAGNPP